MIVSEDVITYSGWFVARDSFGIKCFKARRRFLSISDEFEVNIQRREPALFRTCSHWIQQPESTGWWNQLTWPTWLAAGLNSQRWRMLPVGVAKFTPVTAHDGDGSDVRRRHRHLWARIEHSPAEVFIDEVIQFGDQPLARVAGDCFSPIDWKESALVRIARHEAKNVSEILNAARATTHKIWNGVEILVHLLDLFSIAAKWGVLIRAFNNETKPAVGWHLPAVRFD